MNLNLKNTTYFATPWPHIIIENIIDDIDVVNQLANNTETSVAMSKHSLPPAVRVDVGIEDIDKYNLPSVIKDVLNLLDTSTDLANLLYDQFSDSLAATYTTLSKEYFKTFVKRKSTYGCYNYTQTRTPLKGLHLDNGKKIYSGMIYLREDTDTTSDSELLLWSESQTLEKVIPYTKNLAIFWPNLPNTWHSVSDRMPSETNLRRFINVAFEGLVKLHDYKTDIDINGKHNYYLKPVNRFV